MQISYICTKITLMKRFAFVILLVVVSLWQLTAQEINVPATQRLLITKRTASWCPLCGGWGWTFFRQVLDDNKNKAVFFADHYDGLHTTPTSIAIANNFGGVSQPVFFVNNQNQNVTSSNTASARASIQTQVNTAFATQPIAQSAHRAILNSATGAITVQAKARFFQQASGEFYLGIYLVRKEFVGFQSGQGNNAEHKEVLWGHLTANVFGELIANGNVPAGTEAIVNGQISAAGLDYSKLRIVTIIWRKNGTVYQVVNANEEDSFQQPSAAGEMLVKASRLRVWPNVITESAAVEIDVQDALPHARLELLDATGKVIRTLYRGSLAAGKQQFILHKGAQPAGVYVLRLLDAAGRAETVRVVLR